MFFKLFIFLLNLKQNFKIFYFQLKIIVFLQSKNLKNGQKPGEEPEIAEKEKVGSIYSELLEMLKSKNKKITNVIQYRFNTPIPLNSFLYQTTLDQVP